jgi:hypothetical protein
MVQPREIRPDGIAGRVWWRDKSATSGILADPLRSWRRPESARKQRVKALAENPG